MVEKQRNTIRFILNGEDIDLGAISPRLTLLDWLRLDKRLTGFGELDGIELLQKLPLFAGLTFDETSRLAGIIEKIEAAEGQILIEQNATDQRGRRASGCRRPARRMHDHAVGFRAAIGRDSIWRRHQIETRAFGQRW